MNKLIRLLVLITLILHIASEVCKVQQAGFVLLQSIGAGVLTGNTRGADISGDGKTIVLVQGTGPKKAVLFQLTGTTFTVKGSLSDITEDSTTFQVSNHQSFSTDSTKLTVTGTPVKLYNPKTITGLSPSNQFQSLSLTNQFFIFTELAQDGTLLTASTQNSSFLDFKSYVYFLNGQTGNFIQPPLRLSSGNYKANLNISPNKKYILSYPGLIASNVTLNSTVQIYIRNTSNPNVFSTPTIISNFLNRTISLRGDISDDIAIIGSIGVLRIYTRFSGTDTFGESQNLDSVATQRIVSVKISNDNKYIFIGFRTTSNKGGMSIFIKNSANQYQLFQKMNDGLSVEDIDANENYNYVVTANNVASSSVIIQCFKDYSLNCSEPNKASQCMPTFTVINGSCGCASPLVLSKDSTNCGSDVTLGGSAGCCTTEQTWKREGGGLCVSCPSSLNCASCSSDDVCASCKDGYLQSTQNGIVVCSARTNESISVFLIIIIVFSSLLVIFFVFLVIHWHIKDKKQLSTQSEKIETENQLKSSSSNNQTHEKIVN